MRFMGSPVPIHGQSREVSARFRESPRDETPKTRGRSVAGPASEIKGALRDPGPFFHPGRKDRAAAYIESRTATLRPDSESAWKSITQVVEECEESIVFNKGMLPKFQDNLFARLLPR